jgi:hypothetical protein
MRIIFTFLVIACLVVPPALAVGPVSEVQTRATSAIVALHNDAVLGRATPEEYDRAADALEATFQEWDHNGTTAAMESAIIDHAAEYANPSKAMLYQLYKIESHAALDVDEPEVVARARENLSEAKVANLIAYVKAHGLAPLHAAVIDTLRLRAARMIGRPHIVLAGLPRWICYLDAIAGVYTAMLAVMATFGVITAPLDIPLALFGGVEAVIGLWCI